MDFSELLQKDINTENLQENLQNLRQKIMDDLYKEYVMTCFLLFEEVHSVLEKANKETGEFSFCLSQYYNDDWIEVSPEIDYKNPNLEVSDDVLDKIEYIKTFLTEQFTNNQLKNYFPTEDIVINVENNYSKEMLEGTLLKILLGKEEYAQYRSQKLDKVIEQKSEVKVRRPKI